MKGLKETMHKMCVRNEVKLEFDKAITLISLVITIIILIILAGIVINLSIGQNGIFSRAKMAKEEYAVSQAREKLKTVLMEAVIEKETNERYDNKKFLDDMIEKNGMTVNNENVIVDNYIFKIDREKLKVLDALGETNIKITSQVKEYLGKNANEKYEVQVLIKAEGNIQSAKIEKADGSKIEIQPEEFKIGKDITLELDEEYIITIITNEGKEETRKIVENSEETIRTAQELASFRNKVNTGLTYEGKTIKLENDIDLSVVCGENVQGEEINWQPIGYYNTEQDACSFKGKFNGQYKTINNLYINIDEKNIEKYEREAENREAFEEGLFGYNEGTIENLIMENVYIYIDISEFSKASYYHQTIGAVVATSYGNLNNIGIKSGSITSINTADAIGKDYKFRVQQVGGIAGLGGDNCVIDNCYNNANIYVINSKNYISNTVPYNMIGGIIGDFGGNGASISDCYNSGTIEGNYARRNYIAGLVGRLGISQIKNSYNYGEIIGTGSYSNENLIGGIVGLNGTTSNIKGTIKNSYCTTTIAEYSYYHINNSTKYTEGRIEEQTLKGYSETLGTEFITDGKKIDKNGNIVDNLDSKGHVVYINNGYPILKWQVTEK